MTTPNDALLERISRVHGAILQWRSQLPELHFTMNVQVPTYVGTVEERIAAVDVLSKALGIRPELEFWPSANAWYYTTPSGVGVGAYTPVSAAPLPPQGVETPDNTLAGAVV